MRYFKQHKSREILHFHHQLHKFHIAVTQMWSTPTLRPSHRVLTSSYPSTTSSRPALHYFAANSRHHIILSERFSVYSSEKGELLSIFKIQPQSHRHS